MWHMTRVFGFYAVNIFRLVRGVALIVPISLSNLSASLRRSNDWVGREWHMGPHIILCIHFSLLLLSTTPLATVMPNIIRRQIRIILSYESMFECIQATNRSVQARYRRHLACFVYCITGTPFIVWVRYFTGKPVDESPHTEFQVILSNNFHEKSIYVMSCWLSTRN